MNIVDVQIFMQYFPKGYFNDEEHFWSHSDGDS